jgi:hypothetical protein
VIYSFSAELLRELFKMADSDHDDDITIPRAAMNKMIKVKKKN